MPRSSRFTFSAFAFVVAAAFLGTVVQILTQRVASKIETNFGYEPDAAGTREFLAGLDQPTFAQAGEEAVRKAVGADTYLYRYADAAHQKVYGTPFEALNQGSAGTCVSFGWAAGSFIGQAVDFSTGALPSPPLEICTESIYGGSRTLARLPPVSTNSGGDGSYGAAAARWVSGKCKDPTVGGILYRQKYGTVDLTKYSIPLSRSWGSTGVPTVLAKEGFKHTAKSVAQVNTWQELAASLESGYPVAVCSNVGFAATNTRDEDGFLPRGGNWSHCMVAISLKYAKNDNGMKRPRDGVLILNSWGGDTWVKGGKNPSDQPSGSFWIIREDAEAILRQGDSFSIGGVNGFAYRDLDHGDWMQSK